MGDSDRKLPCFAAPEQGSLTYQTIPWAVIIVSPLDLVPFVGS